MIHQIAVKWADWWADSHIIDAQRKEVYQYGMELLVSTFLNCALMIAVSYFIGMPYAVISYALVYIPLRLTAGGYHAGSHWMCVLYTQATFALSVIGVRALAEREVYSLLPMMLLSGLVVFCLAPVESDNNPQSTSERKRERYRAWIIELVVVLIAMVGVYKGSVQTGFVIVGIAANVSVAFSLVTAKIKNIFMRRRINKCM